MANKRAQNLPTNKPPFEDKATAGKILADMLPMFELKTDTSKPPAYSDAGLLTAAITTYFRHCSAKGLRPGIIGLCAAVDIDYKTYKAAYTGMTHVISSECLAILQKAHRFIDSYTEQTAAAGVLNPVLAIFWEKNFTGLSDSQDITISPRADITATKTLDQLERDIPIDETEKP